MCVNNHTIYNKYIHKSIVVPCGHCPACKQEKANRRANRIRNQFAGSDLDCYFITLTYNNNCVPYISLKSSFSETLFTHEFEIYRDYTCTHKRFKDENGKRVYKSKTEPWPDFLPIDTFYTKYDFSTPQGKKLISSLTPLKGKPGCVGVIYYPDIQRYIKRVRINLERNGYNNNIKYFSCAEYGPTTKRPHYHVLIFAEAGHYEEFRQIFSSSWSFSDYNLTYRNISLAINPSTYVSAYVNCDSSIPELLRNVREVAPKHSMSQHFGFSCPEFSLPAIYESFTRRNFFYSCEKIINKIPTSVDIPIPYYVYNRYFPKCKGYCMLSHDALLRISARPEELENYAYQLGYDCDDLKANISLLTHKRDEFLSYGYNLYDWCIAYSDIWSCRSLALLKNTLISKMPITDIFELYDNIIDYYRGDVSNERLDTLMSLLPSSYTYPIDYNLFSRNQLITSKMEEMYNKYSKDKKIRNIVYSNIIDV